MNTNKLRKTYLEFFRKNSHKVFPSDTLVPDDETVLFTSAGMSRFKPYFLGEKKDVEKAASCQKCLRTGDLERVGKTAYHHTFFEMLGNFSFGDYFKRGAIEFAWEFLIKELNLKEEDLWVSVYKDDKEAFDIWKGHIGVNPGKMVKLGEDTNFWPASAPSKGPNGVCGPCSEIFFDRGKSVGCRRPNCNPDCGCGRFVEIWNLVFTQFNRVGANKLEPLPQKNIDTGMGLERMACVLQGKNNNFEIDILAPVFNLVAEIVGAKNTTDPIIVSAINAVIDHARAAVFAIADGVYPSNEGRGYVIRKIIRKALWSANLLLSGQKDPFIYKTTGLFAELMKEPYPEISTKKDIIIKVIKAEEEKFLSTIKEGKGNLLDEIGELKKRKKNTLNAEIAFKLYDTYGFPLELSKYIAQKHSIKVDEKGFNVLFKKQQELSRKKSKFSEGIFKEGGKTFKEVTEFIGYERVEADCIILRLIPKDYLTQGQEGAIILDKTPFYPEAGGQLTDKGVIKTKTGEFAVEEVFKAAKAIVHKGKVIKGEISGQKAFSRVNEKRRTALARAHTATHLLQAALREVLGNHVSQQGSLVDEDRLRFDFTHFQALTADELEKVKKIVDERILNSSQIGKRVISYDNAKKQGALAFFKDKYKDKVRVVSIGDYSKELCGGIHLNNTSEVGSFFIVRESSISSGIRRIEAVTGDRADTYVKGLIENKLKEKRAAEIKKSRQEQTASAENAVFAKVGDLVSLRRKKIKGIDTLICEIEKKYIQGFTDVPVFARRLADVVKEKFKIGFIFLILPVMDKDRFICMATDGLVKRRISCKKFVCDYGKRLSLKGGGRDNLVQGSIERRSSNFIDEIENCFAEFIGSAII